MKRFSIGMTIHALLAVKNLIKIRLTVRRILHIYRKAQIHLEGRYAMYFPMAIIGRLKVSCRTGPETTTMTAAWTGRPRSAEGAGSISHTSEIDSASLQNVPLSRSVARQERGREKAMRSGRAKAKASNKVLLGLKNRHFACFYFFEKQKIVEKSNLECYNVTVNGVYLLPLWLPCSSVHIEK